MDLLEEYIRCQCGLGQETYEHFLRCEQYKGIKEPLVQDQDISLLKIGERGRSAMQRELGKEGHRKGSWHMVIVRSLWRALQEHTVAPKTITDKLMRRVVEHLQERMACREAQLEARAEDMCDLVTKWVGRSSSTKRRILKCKPSLTGDQGGRRARGTWRNEREKSRGSA